MRNDVGIPPDDSSLDDVLIPDTPKKELTRPVIPRPDKLIADVELFDHPDFSPHGAGNFWLLGFIGLLVLGAVIVIVWMVSGLMK
jgi:hypothetical protein